MPHPTLQKSLPKLLLVFAFGVAAFQFLTLNAITLSGDESLCQLMREPHVRNQLTPIVPYEGPLDVWLFASIYLLTDHLFPLAAAPWMVRIFPMLFAVLGLLALFREVRRQKPKLAPWVAFAAAISPMFLVYSRVAFPQSLFLGLFSYLLAESLRLFRTGEVRWLRLGLTVGFCFEVQTTAMLGVAVVFLPAIRELWSGLKRQPLRAVAAAAIVLILAYPILRNFPPPTSAIPGMRFIFEIKSFLNVLTGHQPLQFLLAKDLTPVVFIVLYFLVLIYAFWNQVRELRQAKSGFDRLLYRHWLVHAAASLFLFFMCYRGRTLTLTGHERHFLVLVPGWTLMQADAFRRLTLKAPKWKLAVPVALFFLVFPRVAIPILNYGRTPDTYLEASRWLEQNCPRGKCVALTENFWNFWPIRYYTRNRIDLDVIGHNWLKQPSPSREGRELALCQFSDNEEPYSGPYREKIVFPERAGRHGQVCYLGVKF